MKATKVAVVRAEFGISGLYFSRILQAMHCAPYSTSSTPQNHLFGPLTCNDKWVSSWRWSSEEVSSLAILSRLLLMPSEGGLTSSSGWPGDGSRIILESIFVSICFLLSFWLSSFSTDNAVLGQEFPLSLACFLSSSFSSRWSVESARDSPRTAPFWLGTSSVRLARLGVSPLIFCTSSFAMTWVPSVFCWMPKLSRSSFPVSHGCLSVSWVCYR